MTQSTQTSISLATQLEDKNKGISLQTGSRQSQSVTVSRGSSSVHLRHLSLTRNTKLMFDTSGCRIEGKARYGRGRQQRGKHKTRHTLSTRDLFRLPLSAKIRTSAIAQLSWIGARQSSSYTQAYSKLLWDYRIYTKLITRAADSSLWQLTITSFGRLRRDEMNFLAHRKGLRYTWER